MDSSVSDSVWYFPLLNLCRLLISHFAKKVPDEIGGGEDCCDNCRNGYIEYYVVHVNVIYFTCIDTMRVHIFIYSVSSQADEYEETDSALTDQQIQDLCKSVKLLLDLIDVCVSINHEAFLYKETLDINCAIDWKSYT